MHTGTHTHAHAHKHTTENLHRICVSACRVCSVKCIRSVCVTNVNGCFKLWQPVQTDRGWKYVSAHILVFLLKQTEWKSQKVQILKHLGLDWCLEVVVLIKRTCEKRLVKTELQTMTLWLPCMDMLWQLDTRLPQGLRLFFISLLCFRIVWPVPPGLGVSFPAHKTSSSVWESFANIELCR